jgi:hypothetical protein
MNATDIIYVVCLGFENYNGDYENQRIKFFKAEDSAKQYIANRIAEIRNDPANIVDEDYTNDWRIDYEYPNEFGDIESTYEEYSIEEHPLL